MTEHVTGLEPDFRGGGIIRFCTIDQRDRPRPRASQRRRLGGVLEDARARQVRQHDSEQILPVGDPRGLVVIEDREGLGERGDRFGDRTPHGLERQSPIVAGHRQPSGKAGICGKRQRAQHIDAFVERSEGINHPAGVAQSNQRVPAIEQARREPVAENGIVVDREPTPHIERAIEAAQRLDNCVLIALVETADALLHQRRRLIVDRTSPRINPAPWDPVSCAATCTRPSDIQ